MKTRSSVHGPGRGFGHDQVLEHRQVAEDLASFRHVADAEPRDPVCGPARHVLAEHVHAALAHGGEPHQAAHRRRLARAVAAEHGDDLALVEPQRDAVQDVALAVERVHVARFEHRAHARDSRDLLALVKLASPRYAARTCSLPEISAGVPSASTRPWSSTVIFWAILGDVFPHRGLVIVAVLDADVAHAVDMRADMALAEIGIFHIGQLVLPVFRAGYQGSSGQHGLGETGAEQRYAVDKVVGQRRDDTGLKSRRRRPW